MLWTLFCVTLAGCGGKDSAGEGAASGGGSAEVAPTMDGPNASGPNKNGTNASGTNASGQASAGGANATGASLPGGQERTDRASVDATPIRLTDVTDQSGIAWTYQNGHEAGHKSILESLGGGAGTLDYDGDGLLDIFLPGGGQFDGQKILGRPSGLFRNLGDFRFLDVSVPAGRGLAAPRYSHGVTAADYDNDGFTDILVTGYGGVQLWHNQGDGTFEDVTADAGMDVDKLWSSSAGWGDFDGDGALDLYVAHYVNWSFANHPRCPAVEPGQFDICPPKVFEGLPDVLLMSNGDGTFRDATTTAGLRPDGKGLGVVLGDIDQDGDLDAYVANDTTDNFLYLNDGKGVFEEVAALAGVAADDRGTPNGSMGVDLGDFNLDGRPDIWAANYEVESFALYRNDGNAQFLHVSQATGVTALNGLFVGFGTGFVDLDRDGDEDLVVTNGHVILFPRASPLKQLPLLLVNDEGRRFRRVEVPESPYWSTPHSGRGLALSDLDNDGDQDFVLSHNQEPVSVLRNDTRTRGNWLQIRLVGRRSNRDAIGATVILETSVGPRMRLVRGGGSYLSQGDLRQFWGFPEDVRITDVVVRWPGGMEQRLGAPAWNESLAVFEPESGL